MTTTLERGVRISHWEILGYLDDGASGTVYEVLDVDQTTLRGAMKICHGKYVNEGYKKFSREVDVVQRQIINGFMPAFIERGEYKGVPYYVMELSEKLHKRNSRREIKAIVERIAQALTILHGKGFVHCDIKPSNLGLINGQAVLLDWGSCREIDAVKEEPVRVGTWKYMAPEVRDRIKLDVQADVYSLAATLDEFCKGNGLRRTYESLILHGMANNTDERIKTIDEFLHEFNTSRDRLTKFAITISVAVAGFVSLGLIYCGVAFFYFKNDRAKIQLKLGASTVPHDYIRSGIVHYLQGSWSKAYYDLNIGRNQPGYSPTNYNEADVEAIFDDCCQRLRIMNSPCRDASARGISTMLR